MTVQEAIMIIEAIPECIWKLMSNTETEAIEMAIKALKKQMDKKPIWEDGLIVFAKCPICKELLDLRVNYCDHCGQAIDWRD